MSNNCSSKSNSYFHSDPAYGLNDWEPVVAFVRALLENTVDKNCFAIVRERVLESNSLLSQTFIQHLGFTREPEGIEIIREKLTQLGPNDFSIVSPLCSEEKYLELVCLESIAMIGGKQARDIVHRYVSDSHKSYLAKDAAALDIPDEIRPNIAPYRDDYPEILKGIRSVHAVVGKGGDTTQESRDRMNEILEKWRALEWSGPVEYLRGDGAATTFKLKNKIIDYIHDFCDPFSDFGIFMSTPKIEYPIGRHRWANSHTFLEYPVVDGVLYGREYTWDTNENTITTFFHKRIAVEEVTVNPDGRTVTVSRKPISTGVELRGNVFSKACSSAVRGVWDNPQKQGKNYYAKRANILTTYKGLIYFRPLHKPIVNQLGIWLVDECEEPQRFFDNTGNCTDTEGVINELLIPLHQPKVLAGSFDQYNPAGHNDRFTVRLPQHMRQDLCPVPPVSILDSAFGAEFKYGQCGYAGLRRNNLNGYENRFDINSDGIIDQKERDILNRHAGEVYRMNIGDYGYFGKNWLSTGYSPRSKNTSKGLNLFVCSYDWGASYDNGSGTVKLLEDVEPGKKLYIEYFCDVPPEAGSEMKVYLHGGM